MLNVKHFRNFVPGLKVYKFSSSVEVKRVVTDQSNKSSLVGIRFLPSEKQKLQQLAAEEEKTLSELVRAIAVQRIEKLNKKVIPEMNRRLYFKLGQVSEKLQTLETFSEALEESQELLNEVRKELVGLDS